MGRHSCRLNHKTNDSRQTAAREVKADDENRLAAGCAARGYQRKLGLVIGAANAEPVSVSVTSSSQYQFTKIDRGSAPVPGADDLTMHSAISETAVQIMPYDSPVDFQADVSVANNWFFGDWRGQQTTDWHLGMALYARDANWGIVGIETAIGDLEGISGTNCKVICQFAPYRCTG